MNKVVCKTMLPNFFIVGAAKSGTSSLWAYLKDHPEVFVPESSLHKEPAFFCNDWGMKSEEQYLSLFKNVTTNHKRIGEASTAYLVDESSAKAIANYSENNRLDTKIIIILRNPADRAYSLYRWNVQSGIEPASTFEKALSLETKRMEQRLPSFWLPIRFRPQYMYFQSGLYSAQVERYLTCFGRDSVHIELFEDFICNTHECFSRICRFLDIDDNYKPLLLRHNPSVCVRSPMLQVLLRQLTKKLIRFNLLKGYTSIKERDFLLRMGIIEKKPAPLSPKTRELLLLKYYSDIKRLDRIINNDLSATWLSELN